jgi:hypothetical protein
MLKQIAIFFVSFLFAASIATGLGRHRINHTPGPVEPGRQTQAEEAQQLHRDLSIDPVNSYAPASAERIVENLSTQPYPEPPVPAAQSETDRFIEGSQALVASKLADVIKYTAPTGEQLAALREHYASLAQAAVCAFNNPDSAYESCKSLMNANQSENEILAPDQVKALEIEESRSGISAEIESLSGAWELSESEALQVKAIIPALAEEDRALLDRTRNAMADKGEALNLSDLFSALSKYREERRSMINSAVSRIIRRETNYPG